MLKKLKSQNDKHLVIVAETNGHGLSRDAHILQELLSKSGWHAEIAHPETRSKIRRYFRRTDYDVVVHLETFHPRWVNAGTRQYLIPNQEWFRPRRLRWLKFVDNIFVKTAHAHEIFLGFSDKVDLIGFTSEDRYDPNIPKNWNKFLHLAGASFLKGTDQILNVWRKHPEWPELILIKRKESVSEELPDNVRLVSEYLSDNDLKTLQNECGVHLCPSRSEGWGHYIVEAMSCGAAIVTTNAPPMNEFISSESGMLVGYDYSEPYKISRNYRVSETDLELAILRLMEKSGDEKKIMGENARQSYLQRDKDFRRSISDIFGIKTHVSEK